MNDMRKNMQYTITIKIKHAIHVPTKHIYMYMYIMNFLIRIYLPTEKDIKIIQR
jgi:hypothetical protein